MSGTHTINDEIDKIVALYVLVNELDVIHDKLLDGAAIQLLHGVKPTLYNALAIIDESKERITKEIDKCLADAAERIE